MKASDVYRSVRHLFTYEHRLENSFMFNWESDLFLLTKAGLSIEIEVKVSKSDFKADFKKELKHILLANHKKQNVLYKKGEYSSPYAYVDGDYRYVGYDCCGVSFCKPAEKIPNRFYYACPEGLISDVPSYAGLIYISESGVSKIVKKAPLLHKLKKDWTKSLMDKYFWRRQNSLNEMSSFEHSLNYIKNSSDREQYLVNTIKKVLSILR